MCPDLPGIGLAISVPGEVPIIRLLQLIMKGPAVAFLLSHLAFLSLCVPLALIHEAWGSRWAFGLLIPLSLVVAIVFGGILNALDLLSNPALVGLPLVLGLLGVIAFVPLMRSFSYSVDSDGDEFESGVLRSGYIFTGGDAYCLGSDFYRSLKWTLIRKGRQVKDSDQRYYAYDAIHFNGAEDSNRAYLYFENVVTETRTPPALPDAEKWTEYCREEAQWFRAIRTAGDSRLKTIQEACDDPEAGKSVPVYVSSESPLFERWLWGVIFAVLLLINSLPGLALFSGRPDSG